MAKTLLLGLGNPILKDDAVGLRVVRGLGRKVTEEEVHVEESSFANIDILDVIHSYDRLIIVDSIKTEGGKPGDLYRLDLDDLHSTLHLSCPHDINLATALELGKRLGMEIPGEIRIYAIEVEDNQTFCETCSPLVEEAIPRIIEEIARTEHLERRMPNSLHGRLQISDQNSGI
ncbi:MAG: hydrogenase maturation protease [Thermodesulfobacteriota bacterium]|jgi:hydrogenase maturation protease